MDLKKIVPFVILIFAIGVIFFAGANFFGFGGGGLTPVRDLEGTWVGIGNPTYEDDRIKCVWEGEYSLVIALQKEKEFYGQGNWSSETQVKSEVVKKKTTGGPQGCPNPIAGSSTGTISGTRITFADHLYNFEGSYTTDTITLNGTTPVPGWQPITLKLLKQR